jgi:hypothetical protein
VSAGSSNAHSLIRHARVPRLGEYLGPLVHGVFLTLKSDIDLWNGATHRGVDRARVTRLLHAITTMPLHTYLDLYPALHISNEYSCVSFELMQFRPFVTCSHVHCGLSRLLVMTFDRERWNIRHLFGESAEALCRNLSA